MSAKRWDIVIRGAEIYDGAGSEPVRGDVAIDGDRIAQVGTFEGRGAQEIDATGLAVSPGFIDVHSHDDFAVFVTPEMDFKVMQGVTTDVVGNCGFGAAPNPPAATMLGSGTGGARLPEWTDYPGYFAALDHEPPSLNVAVLVGHGTLRLAAMGNAEREPTDAELNKMRQWLREGLDAGAVGLSTGLIYEPGRYAKTQEIVDLAHEMAEGGGLYASHMRNEAAHLLDSIRETIGIGAEASVPVQISHHKAAGRENWGRVVDSLNLIDEARNRGLDVTADQYPYTSGSTGLAALMQNDVLGKGGGLGRVAPEAILLASVPGHPEYEGMTLQQVSTKLGLDPREAAERLIDESGMGLIVVIESMDEADVKTVMRHPTTMIASDGIPAGSKPHPRLYGTFPRVLGRYARDGGLLSLKDAVCRMTGMPAAKFRLAGRGRIRPGAYADLVIFDPAAIIDVGTYDDPRRYPAGISHVFVNGTAVASGGRHTGARPGRALRRS